MNKQMVLSLDKLDYEAVEHAIERRQGFGVMPDGNSDENGAAIAEICRGWMEFLDLKRPPK